MPSSTTPQKAPKSGKKKQYHPRSSPSPSSSSSAESSPKQNPASPLRERDLEPFFKEDDPEALRGLCVLGPAKNPKNARSTSKSSPVHQHLIDAKEPRQNYAGPAFLQSPPPDSLPRPSTLLIAA